MSGQEVLRELIYSVRIRQVRISVQDREFS